MIPNGVVTWAEIDLTAIAHNVKQIKAYVGKDTDIIAVVKANAYGHGEIPVAHTLLKAGASRLAVHRTIDGVRLRHAGITAPVLILGYTPPSGIPMVVEQQITPTVIDRDIAKLLSEQANAPFPIHIKVDTGMCRYGLRPEDAVDFVKYLYTLPNIIVEGIFSHFSTADEENRTPMLQQWETFQQVLADLATAGIHIPIRHICNSGGILSLKAAHLEAVRPGILLYGLSPSAECQAPFPLRRAMTLKSLVVRVQELPAGSAIGYGRTYTTPEPMVAALVPIGYGDGYHRLISNRGSILINGQRVPIRGRVSMDQIVVDVTGIEDVNIGAEAVIIGKQGDEEITHEEVAAWAETINYEILTSVHPQVIRVFQGNGHAVT
ncbi:MAG: alanine racemase [Anaerolineae bacterium]|nr:alanine racemase [Anaerolineae bacterium]